MEPAPPSDPDPAAPAPVPAPEAFGTVVLLGGEVEQRNLSLILKRFNPRLEVLPMGTREQLEALSPARLAGARLLAFSSTVMVSTAVLTGLGYGAYNFHPGPPTYPGWFPVNFAVYEGATVFGATAHVMAERVDSGPIVDLEAFEVAPGTTADQLSEDAYAATVRLFWRLAEHLATRPEPLPALPLRWGERKSTRRAFAALCEIPPDIGAEDLARRVAAFGQGDGFSTPTVTLHGFRFRLER